MVSGDNLTRCRSQTDTKGESTEYRGFLYPEYRVKTPYKKLHRSQMTGKSRRPRPRPDQDRPVDQTGEGPRPAGHKAPGQVPGASRNRIA